MTGDVHHAVADSGAHKDTHRGDEDDTLERGYSTAHRRVKEVDRIVRYPYPQVHNRQREEEDNHQKIENRHGKIYELQITNYVFGAKVMERCEISVIKLLSFY